MLRSALSRHYSCIPGSLRPQQRKVLAQSLRQKHHCGKVLGGADTAGAQAIASTAQTEPPKLADWGPEWRETWPTIATRADQEICGHVSTTHLQRRTYSAHHCPGHCLEEHILPRCPHMTSYVTQTWILHQPFSLWDPLSLGHRG